MSGRKIDDHSFWAGSKSNGSVFPEGAKVKHEHSEEGAGEVGMEYSDTTEMVARDQRMGESKAKSHKTKAGYRY